MFDFSLLSCSTVRVYPKTTSCKKQLKFITYEAYEYCYVIRFISPDLNNNYSTQLKLNSPHIFSEKKWIYKNCLCSLNHFLQIYKVLWNTTLCNRIFLKWSWLNQLKFIIPWAFYSHMHSTLANKVSSLARPVAGWWLEYNHEIPVNCIESPKL